MLWFVCWLLCGSLSINLVMLRGEMRSMTGLANLLLFFVFGPLALPVGWLNQNVSRAYNRRQVAKHRAKKGLPL